MSTEPEDTIAKETIVRLKRLARNVVKKDPDTLYRELKEIYDTVDRNKLNGKQETMLNRAWQGYFLHKYEHSAAYLMIETFTILPISCFNLPVKADHRHQN